MTEAGRANPGRSLSEIPMHRVLAVSVLLVAAGSASAAPKIEPAKYGWHTDYAAARAEAKRTGKPMMLVFRCEP